jgi:hypothetical protein
VKRWACAVAVVALGISAARASATTSPALDIRVERDPRPGAIYSALAVNLRVFVTERGTGAAPADDFEVYAFAEPASGSATETYRCAQEHDNSPETPRGVYACTVLVDHGGRWTFHGIVNRMRINPDDQPVALGRASSEFDLQTGEVAAGVDLKRIQGRFVEAALLWTHAAAAAAWLVTAAWATVLALPALRRRLSPFGLHRLEKRFDLLVKGTWAATGLLIGSGTYLLLNQTAYETPFSVARADAVFQLPYGKPYFLTLAVKLGVYALMLAAGWALLREARRQLRAGETVAVRATVRFGATALVGGTVALSLSITLLKYFHELIEAARAVL